MYRFYHFIFHVVLTTISLTGLDIAQADTASQPPIKCVVFSPPKCGTHLIAKVISFILQRDPEFHLQSLVSAEDFLRRCEEASARDSFVVAHNLDKETVYSLLKHGYKIIFTLRDPRDQLISMADWMGEGQWDWFPVARMENREERITELITGKKYDFRCYENCMGKSVKIFSKIRESECYTAHFEYLVGPEGGGDLEEQLEEIINIAAFLKVKMSLEHAQEIAGGIFGGTSTFRKGQIGVWKENFTEYQKMTYKRLYGRTLIKLGYEKRMSW